jgi:hypothetical protein
MRAVIDLYSRGHGGREDGSLTLAVGENCCIPQVVVGSLVHNRTSLNAVEWETKRSMVR